MIPALLLMVALGSSDKAHHEEHHHDASMSMAGHHDSSTRTDTHEIDNPTVQPPATEDRADGEPCNREAPCKDAHPTKRPAAQARTGK